MRTLLAAAVVAALTHPTLTTEAERSHFARTGRYAEVVELCHGLAKAHPGRARCDEFGTTPEGRPMLVLVASEDGVLDPAAARAKSRPVVLFQGGIHAGEIDGKDAGLWLVRDLLEGKAGKGVLGGVTAVFVPVFNVDGHERFGKNQRPNQNGPAEMGFRTTAHRLNLNRDYVKAEAPEMRAMLALLGRWDPIAYVDLHVTDGMKLQHDVAVLTEPRLSGPEPLRKVGQALQDALFAKLSAQGHLPLPFYPMFEDDDRPESGFAVGIPPPRFSHAYWPLRNRIAILVETHSWKDYGTRVRATRDVLLGVLELAAKDGASWLAAARQADDGDRGGSGGEVVLAWDHGKRAETVKIRGYAWERVSSPASGKPYVRYDDTRPQVWELPWYPELVPAAKAQVPLAGWVVPPAQVPLVREKLALHGFASEVLQRPFVPKALLAFRATATTVRPGTFEGRPYVTVKGAWGPERRELPAGSLFVPAAQPGRQLLVHLLEPAAPDSLVSWGYLANALEQKEYVEDYVLEPWAAALLAKDTAVKAELDRRLAADEAFAKDPAARLRFFHRRHPSWDSELGLVPVFRVDDRPVPPER